MEQKILKSYSVENLNKQIAESISEGFVPIGNHIAITTHSQNIFSGLQHKRIEYSIEYSQSVFKK
jgi:hypothetical protein